MTSKTKPTKQERALANLASARRLHYYIKTAAVEANLRRAEKAFDRAFAVPSRRIDSTLPAPTAAQKDALRSPFADVAVKAVRS